MYTLLLLYGYKYTYSRLLQVKSGTVFVLTKLSFAFTITNMFGGISGELINRSAKVSNLPGTISREFLDVVFSRAYAVIEGTTVREYLIEKEGKLQQKLLEIKDFNG